MSSHQKSSRNTETSALLENISDDTNAPTTLDIDQVYEERRSYGTAAESRPRTKSTINFHSSITSLYFYLYLSHFLSTWNARVLEYGATLFLSSLFPNTFVPLSFYALFRSLSSVVFSHPLGKYIDTVGRLKVVRTSIVYQRLAVAITCLCFWAMEIDIHRSYDEGGSIYTFQIIILMIILIVCACAERLCSTMNTVAVERDWVVVLSKSSILHEAFDSTLNSSDTDESNQTESSSSETPRKTPSVVILQTLNARMRRIDLFCKLVGPLSFSYLFAYLNVAICLWILLVWNLVSMFVEYGTIENVYRRCVELHVPKVKDAEPVPSSDSSSEESFNDTNSNSPNSPNRSLMSKFVTSIHENFTRPFHFYFSHPMALPSFSLSLLYLTVLSFGAQMVSFLLFCGSSPVEIGLLRTLSSFCELSATFLAPFGMRKIGTKTTGGFFILWQATCLATGLAIAWPILNWDSNNGPVVQVYRYLDSQGYIPSIAASISSAAPKFEFGSLSPKVLLLAFVFSIIFSRIGLWGFDLCVQVLIQEGVSPTHQARFSATEAACQSFFELLSYAQTLLWNTPQQFRWPVSLSVTLTTTAALVYFFFLAKSRGSTF